MAYETLAVERDGAVMTVRLNRPEKRNAINRQMHLDLQALCRELAEDFDTRVVILDCLWLVAGIIPGVVALAVDFTTGAAYFSEGEVKLSAGNKVSVNIYGKAPAEAEVVLRLVNADGRDLTRPDRANVVAGEELDSLSLSVPDGIDASGVKLVLAVDGREQVWWTVQPRRD